MKLAWLTDVHLNFLRPPAVEAFLRHVASVEADAVLLSGDVGEAPDVVRHLDALDAVIRRLAYFVLGNHDFYRGSIAGVWAQVQDLCAARPGLHWLPDAGVVPLIRETGLVGHDGWGDGRLGDYWCSPVELSDWPLIADFAGLDRSARLARLNELGDEATAHLWAVLPDALGRFGHVVVVTHVLPFREACWYRGQVSDDDCLPHFTCKAAGDVLAGAMRARPDRRMTVVCGHTHGTGEAQILPKLRVFTGGAAYGTLAVQRVLAMD